MKPTDEEVQIAAALAEARRLRKPIAPFGQRLRGGVLDAAYRIQKINTDAILGRGVRQVGRKIGLTSKAVQKQLGVDQPDFGVLFEDMWFNSGELIPTDRLLQPRIEAEVAFVLGRDINSDDVSRKELEAAIDHAFIAAEIVDSAIEGWKISLADTIGDNASCGLFVLGEKKCRLSELDLRLCGAVVSRNGNDVSFGVGAACLGHPLNAVKWLSDMSAKLGAPLRAGEIILSGALGPMVDVLPGDVFEIEAASLGKLIVPFSSEQGS